MNKSLVVIPILLLALLSGKANAESFVGVSLGVATYPDFVTSDTTAVVNYVANANPGFTIRGTGVQDASSNTFNLFGGAWINENAGVEVGYINFGKPGETITTTGVATTWTADVTSTAFYGAALLGMKASDKTRLYAKLGGYQASTAVTYKVTGPGGSAGTSQSVSNSGGVIGIGSSFQLSDSVGMRVEYEQFSQVKITNYANADIRVFSLGLTHTF